MIDKYLRSNNSEKEKNFLLKKKDDQELESQYNKFFVNKDDNVNDAEENYEIDSENNRYLMKDDEIKDESAFPIINANSNKKSKHSRVDSSELPVPITNSNFLKKEKVGEEILSLINKKDAPENTHLRYENIYLNEGKVKSNINGDTFNHMSPKKDITLENNINNIISSINSENLSSLELYNKNEFKFKKLQEKIEANLRNEYENKIKQKEKEIETKAKNEFEEAMSILKSELERNLDNEKQRMEDELNKRWQDKYEDLLVDCKAKLREDKEKKLANKIYNKLKPEVEKEIYKNEYKNVEDKIRKELENKLNQDIQAKKMEELERVKRKLEYFTKVKMDEMQGNLKSKCKEEIQEELKKDLKVREKELKISYLKRFETFKNNLEKQLKDEYESKKKELSKEIGELKSKVYRQKCAEKLKLNKINNMKKTLETKQKLQLENAEKLEKAIQISNNTLLVESKVESLKNTKKESKKAKNNNHNNQLNIKVNEYYIDDTEIIDNNKNTKILEQNIAVNNNNNYTSFQSLSSHNINSHNSYVLHSSPKNKENSGVNLMEINKKLKSLNNVEIMNNDNRKEVSLIIKDMDSSQVNLKDNLQNMISKNTQMYYKQTSQEVPTEEQKTIYNKFIYKQDNNNNNSRNEKTIYNLQPKEKETFKISKDEELKSNPAENMYINIAKENESTFLSNCLSLRLNANVPASLPNFGKFLIKFIENEENYRILYEKEIKSFKTKIKKIFDLEKVSDHCLLDYMIELWEKLEVSFCNRYKILTEIVKR
jgi:hypothetical protein